MGIILVGIGLFLFENRVRKSGSKAALVLNLALVVYVIFSIILNDYLQYVYGWDYGVAGVDLKAHFNGALALSKGVKIQDLRYVAPRFKMSISGITYIIYAVIVQIVSFSPVIVSYRFSLHLMYTLQIMIAILGADNICRLFPKQNGEYNYRLLLGIVSCVCVAQQAALLMRDIWVFYLLTLILKDSFDNTKNTAVIVVLSLICAVLRAYSLIIIIPILMWKYTKKVKWGIISSGAITGFFLAGQNIIRAFAVWFGVKWEFGFNYDFVAIIRYILFPNIISQTYNVQHMLTGYHANFGGNTEWIYYLLACWNVWIYPLAIYGMYKVFTRREKKCEGIVWLGQIVNISLLYSAFYNSVSEPRHKLLIIFGLLYFFNEGIKRISKKAMAVYSYAVIIFLLGVFLAVG